MQKKHQILFKHVVRCHHRRRSKEEIQSGKRIEDCIRKNLKEKERLHVWREFKIKRKIKIKERWKEAIEMWEKKCNLQKLLYKIIDYRNKNYENDNIYM